jgi:hypothetical protein
MSFASFMTGWHILGLKSSAAEYLLGIVYIEQDVHSETNVTTTATAANRVMLITNHENTLVPAPPM